MYLFHERIGPKNTDHTIGHTKFTPDRLFSAIGSAYKAADVFTINDLNEICAQSATAHIENGGDVFTWRNYLGLK